VGWGEEWRKKRVKSKEGVVEVEKEKEKGGRVVVLERGLGFKRCVEVGEKGGRSKVLEG
jgi:hypothetical protein